jgi:oxygen-independent coproporphyrinogen-3 oxidase
MEPQSLYLHIPFCQHRCAYCDFNTYTTLSHLKKHYVEALGREIKQVAGLAAVVQQKRPLRTIFFGGGTPSLLAIEDLHYLLDCLRQSFGLASDSEITLEANPDTIDYAYLAGMREMGVNRLSIGVQSALNADLALLERTHDFPKVIAIMADARAAGFDNISLDLIYGLPGQNRASWARSLAAVLELEPDHLSLYCLTIEPGTPMHRWLSNGRIAQPDPDLAAAQYNHACQELVAHGFKHYEISNWARPGFECRHNLTYWRNQPYLGLGAGAHGQANRYRYHLVKQPRVYIRRINNEQAEGFPFSSAVLEKHEVTRQEAMSDTVIMQLRLLHEGLDLDQFEHNFGQALDDAYDGLVSQMVEWGLLMHSSGRILLTERGRFISNQVFYRFI